jgi:hypothetical protein
MGGSVKPDAKEPIYVSDLPASDVRYAPLPWQLAGLTWTASGYGAKIATKWQILTGGRWRRVYATCYSNAPSLWIQRKAHRIPVRDTGFNWPREAKEGEA